MKIRLVPVLYALIGTLGADPSGPVPGERGKAIEQGIRYLLASQKPDGSWGSATREVFAWNTGWPAETYRAWKVATTALCGQALMAHPETPEARKAIERGTDYLLCNTDLKRSNDWDTDYVWGLIYSLETLSLLKKRDLPEALLTRIDTAVPRLIRHLATLQNPSGGWNYYDYTRFGSPALATSFTTANALIALHAAREAGYAVPDATIHAAIRAIRKTRLPSGAYAYYTDAVQEPFQVWWDRSKCSINDVRGSLARIQVANLAFCLESPDTINEHQLIEGIDLFFRHHKFLDIACYHHVPHDTFHRNSSYFYLYGHAYAAHVIRRLPADLRSSCRARLDREILKVQLPDGSWWDYPLHGFAKPYGTAFALIALAP